MISSVVISTSPRPHPDSTEWALRLTRERDATRIEQTFKVVKGSTLEPLYATMLPAHCDRTEALRYDLERIGELARMSTGGR